MKCKAQPLLLVVLIGIACDDAPITTSPRPDSAPALALLASSAGPSGTPETAATLSASSLTLPFSESANTAGAAFWITQLGTGKNAGFSIDNPSNNSTALSVSTLGNGYALWGITGGLGGAAYFLINNLNNTNPAVLGVTTGRGSAGIFEIDNSTSGTTALSSRTFGTGRAGLFVGGVGTSPTLEARTSRGGAAVYGYSSGTGRAGEFRIDNATSPNAALVTETRGRGVAGFFQTTNPLNSLPVLVAHTSGIGRAAEFQIVNVNSSAEALRVHTVGTGTTFLANQAGSLGDLAVFQANGVNQIRFDRTGRGFFNNGTQNRGADIAEALNVEGSIDAYEPGDVLVISARSDRRVEKTAEPYSTRVIGVYATAPGVLLTERSLDAGLDGLVPVGVLGVIPTKVSAEGGAIRRGDLLVTAGTPAHAMKGDAERLRFGSILGKALEEFRGPGTGMVRVLVSPK